MWCYLKQERCARPGTRGIFNCRIGFSLKNCHWRWFSKIVHWSDNGIEISVLCSIILSCKLFLKTFKPKQSRHDDENRGEVATRERCKVPSEWIFLQRTTASAFAPLERYQRSFTSWLIGINTNDRKRDGHEFRTTRSYLGIENDPQSCNGRAQHVAVGGAGAGPAMQARTRRCRKNPVPLQDLIWVFRSPTIFFFPLNFAQKKNLKRFRYLCGHITRVHSVDIICSTVPTHTIRWCFCISSQWDIEIFN